MQKRRKAAERILYGDAGLSAGAGKKPGGDLRSKSHEKECEAFFEWLLFEADRELKETG